MLRQNREGYVPGDKFFAAFAGPSMNPTLREPEIIEVAPYESRPMRIGDVAFFLSPKSNHPVVHRIVRVTPAGISTLGDNNSQEDHFLLQPKEIKGRVVAAWRGQKRRKIAGGLQGRLTTRWLRWRRLLGRGVSHLLRPFYHALSASRLICRLLPAHFRPQVVVFKTQDKDQFQLLLGQHIIGRHNDQQHKWLIQRPFHLLVDADALPVPHDENRSNGDVLNEWKLCMNPQLSQPVLHKLVLADGSHWEIAAMDEEAATIVSELGRAMQLTKMNTHPLTYLHHCNVRRLNVMVKAFNPKESPAVNHAKLYEDDGTTVCILRSFTHTDGLFIQLMELSLVFAHEVQAHGGVLIHGALAEREGIGVILAAPSGTGKTTASSRLPAPWRSLCDDTTLVVRNPQGNFYAHPWPTWSRFMEGGVGGRWEMQRAVPVNGIFFLDRANEDSVERVGTGHGLSLLVESAEQNSQLMARGLSKEENRALHLERFNNLCALARTIPTHILRISLTGAFWQKIEQALLESCCEETGVEPSHHLSQSQKPESAG